MPAFTAVMSFELLQPEVDRRAIRSGRHRRRIAEWERVIMLEIVSQALSEVIWNVVFLPQVGSKLRAGDRKSKAALGSTADQETLVRVRE
jgi:hypothetical protein